jgi:hypothetical protein
MLTFYKSLVLVGALGIAGCVGTQESDAQRAASTCASYGFQPQTPHMAQCIQLEVSNIYNRRQAGWAALSDAAQALEGPPQTSTRCTAFGNQMNCKSTGF